MRLLGLGEVDCAATPNDPVCAAFYSTGGTMDPRDAVAAQIIAANRGKLYIIAPNNSAAAAAAAQLPNSLCITNPAACVAAGLTATTPWYKTWWGISLFAVAGVGAMYHYKKSKKAA